MSEKIQSQSFDNGTLRVQRWEGSAVQLSHAEVDYVGQGTRVSKNEEDLVRLHFGLKGAYDFSWKEQGTAFSLQGHHNNLMYSKGLEIAVHNKSLHIETFGVNFHPETFLQIAQNGNDLLKSFAEKVARGETAILAPDWRPNTPRIREVIREIIRCPYQGELRQLFLFSKSIELLVLQASLYEEARPDPFIRSQADQRKLHEAREILDQSLENPPGIPALSRLCGLNEYKLKRGFKELFGHTIFGYIRQNRLEYARQLLLDTAMSGKEIAFQTGFCSPQHFSRAFKKEFGIPPSDMRKAPDGASPK